MISTIWRKGSVTSRSGWIFLDAGDAIGSIAVVYCHRRGAVGGVLPSPSNFGIGCSRHAAKGPVLLMATNLSLTDAAH